MDAKPNKNWEPALLRGDQLRSWAQNTAEAVTATKLLSGRSADSCSDLIQSIHAGAQQAMDAGPNEGKHACHKGCPGCCHSMISLTAPEACVISDWVRDRMSPQEAAAIRQNAAENAAKAKDKGSTEYAESMLWCPFLDSHLSCSIHSVRPLSCRAWNSLSLEACHDCYFSNHADKTLPLDGHTYEIGQGVRSGLSDGIKAMGLDGNHYELNSAMVTALDTPDAAERWARGEPVFEDCHQP